MTGPDGARTEYFAVPADEPTLRALLGTLFEAHWREVVCGPCLEGAVFELRFAERPQVSYLDGYLTVGPPGGRPWHFHLCVGPHRGTPTRPTPAAQATQRRCTRAAFFRESDPAGRPAAWGLRLWNGRDEQMATIFFPNPWLDAEGDRYVATPDWSRLDLWMGLRQRYAGVPPEPPPADATPPATH